MILSVFNHLKMKTKALIIIILIAVLALGGVLAILFQNGTIKFKADTITKNVTVTGKFTDAVSGDPVQKAKIVISAGNRTPASIITKDDGTYRAVLNINPSDEFQRMISIKQDNPGYPDGEGSSFTQVIEDTSAAPTSINQNLQLSPLPSDPVSTRPLDADSERCRTKQYENEYLVGWIHSGDYYGKDVEGVLFCTDTNTPNLINDNLTDLFIAATQIKFLKDQTGLPYLPTIYLVNDIYWHRTANGNPPAGYVEFGANSIVLKAASVGDDRVITHEFGHLVDWEKGFYGKSPASYPILLDDCKLNVVNYNFRCPASAYKDFNEAYIYARNNSYDLGSEGYMNTNRHEMFAEFFAGLFVPWEVNPDPPYTTFSSREKLRYTIENLLLGNFSYQLTFNSKIFAKSNWDSLVSTHKQNVLIYLYKFVAKSSNVDEYFPGTVERWGQGKIVKGEFMKTGFVSFKLADHANRPMEKTNISVALLYKMTRLKKDSNVFSDGTGDLFDTTGTAIIPIVPKGTGKIVDIPTPPDYYQGAVFSRMTRDIRQGANPVIDLSYANMSPPYIYYDSPTPISTIGVTGKILFYTEKNDPYRWALPIKKGAVSRYPELGTTDGKTVQDPKYPTDPMKVINYSYLIGGNLGKMNNFVIGKGTNTYTKGMVCWKVPPPRTPLEVGKTCNYICDDMGGVISKTCKP